MSGGQQQRQLKITAIYVTHDQGEALAISDRIIVMNKGRIEQDDVPFAVYKRPRCRFLAEFIGTANVVDGVVEACYDDHTAIRTEPGMLRGPAAAWIARQPVSVCRRPEDMVFTREEGDNVLEGTVRQSIYMGSGNDLFLSARQTGIRAFVDRELQFDESQPVRFRIPSHKIQVMAG